MNAGVIVFVGIGCFPRLMMAGTEAASDAIETKKLTRHHKSKVALHSTGCALCED